MQDFQDNGKNKFKNGHQSAILDFIYGKFVMGYPCVRSYILLYTLGPAILLCLRKYVFT